jgi:hypothetical protein
MSGATEESRKSHKDWILRYAQYDRSIVLMLITQPLRFGNYIPKPVLSLRCAEPVEVSKFRNEITIKVSYQIALMKVNWYYTGSYFIQD